MIVEQIIDPGNISTNIWKHDIRQRHITMSEERMDLSITAAGTISYLYVEISRIRCLSYYAQK